MSAYEHGMSFENQGDKDKGLGYRKFAVGVLYTAYELDSTNIDVIKNISEFTEKLGDSETSLFFKEKLKK